MPVKILRASVLRRTVVVAKRTVLWLVVMAQTPHSLLQAPDELVTRDSRLASPVSGRLTLLDKGDRPAEDVGLAVIWLATGGPLASAPIKAEITTANKQFSPHVLVVPLGSTVRFPNHDPFNHNVFSLSEEHPFDLGLYGRGETRSVKLERAGIIRIYCNVHAQMSAVVVVRDNPYFAQPSNDGSFSMPPVPPGRYELHAWHERSPELTRELTVPIGGIDSLDLQLDARGYKFQPHMNKFGRPYPQQGRRY